MSDSLSRVGFVGVGTIARALITGMCAGGDRRAEFLLSPRNDEIATGLAARYPHIRVAADNQAVIDGSDIVFLAIRPQIAEDVLDPLTFRADQRIVSLVATFGLERLHPLVAPATLIARAVPLPPVARREAAMTLYPPNAEIAALLQGLGEIVQLDSEADIDSCLAVTALMGSYFGMLEGISGWLTERGIPSERAQSYVGAVYHALGTTAGTQAGDGFGRLSVEYSTPGGLNEQAWRELKAVGWSGLVSDTLDLILDRIGGRATLADRLPGNRDHGGNG